MATICPTVLAETAEDFKAQMDRIAPFATRVQIDLADGAFAPIKTVPIVEAWWPVGVKADVHLMYREPLKYVINLIDMHPQMVIVHAEATGSFAELAQKLHAEGIKVGVALMPETSVETIASALNLIDHVMIFSGNLGRYGGQANLALLNKVGKLKMLKPKLEIGWDGGINDLNAKALALGGVDVLNVGGFIQKASDPVAAYAKLGAKVSGI